MKRFNILALVILISTTAVAQYNFGFEEYKPGTDTLAHWNKTSGPSFYGPLFNIDKEIKHSGNQSLSIERRPTDTATKFTPVSVMIPADFEGDQLTISCWLKTENVKGRAQMWLNIISPAGSNLRLINFPASELTGTVDWKEYTTTVNLPEDAASINFGFLIVGTGKVWADDFNMLVDEKPLEQMAKNKKPVFKASADVTDFSKGSGLELIAVDADTKENLALLGKIWGFLKYYHPTVAKGNLNWDYELFRFLPSYLAVTDKQTRNQLLLQWVDKLGKPVPCKSCSEKELDKAIYKPDLEWLSDRGVLGDQLAESLLYIKNNRHQGKNYYMDLLPGVRNPKITHEDSYTQFAYPDAGYRLLTLFRYWNIIQYWFPYKHLIGEDWKNVLTDFIPKMIAAKNSADYVITTQQLVGRIHDTHANISDYRGTLDSLKGKFYSTVKIKFLGDSAVVSTIAPTPVLNADIQTGDIILSVNGRKISDIIREKQPNLPASNYPTQLRNLAYELLRGHDSAVTIVLKRNDKIIETILPRFDSRKIKIPYQTFDYPYQKDSSFFYIKPGIGYINLGKIRKLQVDSVFEALKGSDGLIIDNRQYPADFPIYNIAGHIVPEKKVFTSIPAGSLDYPGSFAKKDDLTVGKKNGPHYDKRIVVLVNENTQSSAEFHTMAFQQSPQAIVVGSTTAGADGNVSGFYLPGGLYTMFSGISILYPDGRETQRIGIVPDVWITPTIQGIKSGKDELVEKAVELIREPILFNKKNEF